MATTRYDGTPDRRRSVGLHLLRLFLRQPVVVFCVLVIVLDLDCVTGSRGGTGERNVFLVARLGIDVSIGPARSVRARNEGSGSVASMGGHESSCGFSMAGPCARGKRWCGSRCAEIWMPRGYGLEVGLLGSDNLLFEPASRQPAACRRASAVAQTICSDSVFSFARPASISASSLCARLASSP